MEWFSLPLFLFCYVRIVMTVMSYEMQVLDWNIFFWEVECEVIE